MWQRTLAGVGVVAGEDDPQTARRRRARWSRPTWRASTSVNGERQRRRRSPSRRGARRGRRRRREDRRPAHRSARCTACPSRSRSTSTSAATPPMRAAVTLKDFMATDDAPTRRAHAPAGAVALARTNMPDLGLRINTESSLYGATHNPWKRGHTAGGSSGGEAARHRVGDEPDRPRQRHRRIAAQPGLRLRHRVDQAFARSRAPGQSDRR